MIKKDIVTFSDFPGVKLSMLVDTQTNQILGGRVRRSPPAEADEWIGFQDFKARGQRSRYFAILN